MCPGCTAAGALQELGSNPIRTLIDALAKVLPVPSRTEPGTVAAPQDQASPVIPTPSEPRRTT